MTAEQEKRLRAALKDMPEAELKSVLLAAQNAGLPAPED